MSLCLSKTQRYVPVNRSGLMPKNTDFHLCCFYFSAVLVVCSPVPFGVSDSVWKLIVSVPDHCIFICFVKPIHKKSLLVKYMKRF